MSAVTTRQTEITRLLQDRGTVHIHDLAARLQTSPDTIRRDLRQMEETGILRRIHGGATLPVTAHGSFHERARDLVPERAEIARKVAHDLIPDQAMVFFDSGTTIHEVARHLKPSFAGTIITVNPMVAVELAAHPLANVILIGGTLIKRDMVVTGPAAIDHIRQFNADLVLLGTCALHPEQGLTTSNNEERASKAAMLAQSAEAIAIATADKLETSQPYRVCGLDAISRLVTGRKLSPGYLKNFSDQGVAITLA